MFGPCSKPRVVREAPSSTPQLGTATRVAPWPPLPRLNRNRVRRSFRVRVERIARDVASSHEAFPSSGLHETAKSVFALFI